MTLDDFLAETRAEIVAQMSEGSPTLNWFSAR